MIFVISISFDSSEMPPPQLDMPPQLGTPPQSCGPCLPLPLDMTPQVPPLQDGLANLGPHMPMPAPPGAFFPAGEGVVQISKQGVLADYPCKTPELTPREYVPTPCGVTVFDMSTPRGTPRGTQSIFEIPPHDSEGNDFNSLDEIDGSPKEVIVSNVDLTGDQTPPCPQKASWADMMEEEDDLPKGPLWADSSDTTADAIRSIGMESKASVDRGAALLTPAIRFGLTQSASAEKAYYSPEQKKSRGRRQWGWGRKGGK